MDLIPCSFLQVVYILNGHRTWWKVHTHTHTTHTRSLLVSYPVAKQHPPSHAAHGWGGFFPASWVLPEFFLSSAAFFVRRDCATTQSSAAVVLLLLLLCYHFDTILLLVHTTDSSTRQLLNPTHSTRRGRTQQQTLANYTTAGTTRRWPSHGVTSSMCADTGTRTACIASALHLGLGLQRPSAEKTTNTNYFSRTMITPPEAKRDFTTLRV